MSVFLGQEIELKCPECQYVQPITLEDAMNEKQIICGGCKKTIGLKLEGDDPSKAENSIKSLLNNFPKKIEIKL